MSYQEDAEAREHRRELVAAEDDRRRGTYEPPLGYEWMETPTYLDGEGVRRCAGCDSAVSARQRHATEPRCNCN